MFVESFDSQEDSQLCDGRFALIVEAAGFGGGGETGSGSNAMSLVIRRVSACPLLTFGSYRSMAQEQRIVPLVFFKREPGQAVSTGNNAAWICVCRRVLPLIGRTGLVKGVAEATRVVCPDCGRGYFVVPDGYDQAAAREVREV